MLTPTVSTPSAAAYVESPPCWNEKNTTPSVSEPDDHSSADSVSSLNAVRKISSAPAAAVGAISGRMIVRSRRARRAPAICDASSSVRSSW